MDIQQIVLAPLHFGIPKIIAALFYLPSIRVHLSPRFLPILPRFPVLAPLLHILRLPIDLLLGLSKQLRNSFSIGMRSQQINRFLIRQRLLINISPVLHQETNQIVIQLLLIFIHFDATRTEKVQQIEPFLLLEHPVGVSFMEQK